MGSLQEISTPPYWDEPRNGLNAPVVVDADLDGLGIVFTSAVDGWRVEGKARRADGRVQIRELRLTPFIQRFLVEDTGDEEDHDLTGGEGLRTNGLRRIPVARLTAAIQAAAAQVRARNSDWRPGTWDAVPGPDDIGYVAPRSHDAATRIARIALAPGRPRLTDDFLGQVAYDLVQLVQSGSRSAVKDLASKMSQQAGDVVPISRVRQWVKRAEAEGWLIRGASGVADAYATPKLTDWIEQKS